MLPKFLPCWNWVQASFPITQAFHCQICAAENGQVLDSLGKDISSTCSGYKLNILSNYDSLQLWFEKYPGWCFPLAKSTACRQVFWLSDWRANLKVLCCEASSHPAELLTSWLIKIGATGHPKDNRENDCNCRSTTRPLPTCWSQPQAICSCGRMSPGVALSLACLKNWSSMVSSCRLGLRKPNKGEPDTLLA